ncbi:MAG: hypothetical protein EXX96DRAFT_536542 [Benjaminiella poitrasii]|nr:MAG: hypothetical protein EXX96DRAFT_536542 [Benjaminiella poitrasii]
MKLGIKVQTAIASFDKTNINKQRTSSDVPSTQNFVLDSKQKRSMEFADHHQRQKIEQRRSSSTSPIHNLTSITPPPSPSPKSKLRYSQKTLGGKNRTNIDILADELIVMYEQVLHQCNTAENRYKRLDLTMKSTLSLQAQTYEVYIEDLKKQISQLEQSNKDHRKSLLSTDKDDNRYSLVNNDFINSILINYVTPNEEEDGDSNDATKDASEHQLKEEIDKLKEQIKLSEQSAQQMMAHYIRELEQERLKTKKLEGVIAKQDDLIVALESKLLPAEEVNSKDKDKKKLKRNSSMVAAARKSEKLLEAQVEIQAVELEDKKKLLSILIDERDELLKKVEYLSKDKSLQSIGKHNTDKSNSDHRNICRASEPAYQRKRNDHGRSSIDLLAKIAKFDVTTQQSNNHSKQSTKNAYSHIDFSSPPPSPPPKNPLPPTPPTHHQTNLPVRSSSSIHSKKGIPTKLATAPTKQLAKSWSYLNYEAAKDSSSYFVPPSNHEQKPAYYPMDSKSLNKEWRDIILKDFHALNSKADIDSNSQHTSSFSSLLKSWKKRTVN